jgi:hypothetical protein
MWDFPVPPPQICYNPIPMKKWCSGWLASVAFILAGLPASPSTAAEAESFTIVALPDTQYYSKTFPKVAAAQIDWIIANRENLNIVYVAHLGDVTDGGDEKPEQWTNATDALYRLENPTTTGLPAGIPYGVVPGNHDHRGGIGQFEKYFGVRHFAGRPYFGGHPGNSNSSHYDVFTSSGVDFVVLYIDFNRENLDYTPIDNWADEVLKANPHRRAIVVSHDLLAVTGMFDPRGQAIYDKLKSNPNLFLMLCGHHHGEARRFDTFEGRSVLTILSDYQTWPEGGGGYLRILRFFPSENLVRVQTCSPWLNKFKTDGCSQFEFSCRVAGGTGGLGFPPPEPSVVPGELEPAKSR